MSNAKLREFNTRQPFRPYQIHMSDGRSYLVTHPEAIAFTETGRTVLHLARDERVSFLDIKLMTGVEDAKPKPRRRGRSRAK